MQLMDITTRLREVPTLGHDAGCVVEAADEIDRLRGLILRSSAELEIVDYENDPPARVVALMGELRAVNRVALLTANVK